MNGGLPLIWFRYFCKYHAQASCICAMKTFRTIATSRGNVRCYLVEIMALRVFTELGMQPANFKIAFVKQSVRIYFHRFLDLTAKSAI